MITLTLPWPPSTNTVWRNVHGRTLLSRKGRQFRKDVATAVAGQHHGEPLAARLSVVVTLLPPDRRKRDIDNHGGKALLDALTHAGIWLDDEQIDRLTIIRGERLAGGQCLVEIKEAA
ncbi:RusA family crossover junction endodeoxyribonuclease [Halomonas sp. DP5Y7-2]|uniref:RusA family crossover junction endodeoxyribonuclease n=1 Tax=Halomonas sp. DP5Y7-2 TaxID=2859076 RepID=UPI001C9A13FD|nr:RusA family crossover junction endodeoxyribonuclease [Halomonas sp. DP5Y7-2]MBY5984436.1 RusA family crossover junction endodeoxyribonuclease [Halomonas sp. DP5Y7-2]